MRPQLDLLQSDRVRLERKDLVRWEHFIKDALAEFVSFSGYSLYFPRSLARKPGSDFDPSSDQARHLPRDGQLMVPLRHGGKTLAVFVARGVRQTEAEALLPAMPRAAALVLEQLALYKAGISDPLTGLLNRAAFLRSIEREIDLIQDCLLTASEDCVDPGLSPYSGQCGLLLLDIDNFAHLTRDAGFVQGERLIARVAETLAGACPEQTLLARLDSDRFGLLWPDGAPKPCLKLARTLLETVSRREFPLGPAGDEVRLTLSAGFVHYPADLTGNQLRLTTPEKARILLGKAGRALRAAKENGRDRAFPFDRILTEGGRVLRTLPMGRLSVGLGRREDAREGLRFLVLPPDGASARGPAVYKGEIMLMEVGQDASHAEVIHQSDPAWPLEPGDRLNLVREPAAAMDDETRSPGRPQKDILTGLYGFRDFQTAWTSARRRGDRFGLAMLRLSEKDLPRKDFQTRMEDMVRELAGICMEAFGKQALGGRYSLNTLCFHVPDAGARELSEHARRIVEAASERMGATLAAGLAAHPYLTFSKTDIFENCLKALDHALMLPEPMVAVFDSVSLNVSADRLFTQGDLYGAIEEYKLSLLADDTNTLARNSLGICLARLGKLEQALSHFEQVSLFEPDNLMALYNYGHVCLRLGEHEQAEKSFTRCLKLTPGHIFSLIRLGQIAESRGEPEKARELYLSAMRTEEGTPVATRHLARASLALGLTEDAREHLHQALIHNPYDAVSMHLLATLYLDGGEDPEIAETLARQAVALRPERRAFWNALSRALTAGGKDREADEAHARAQAL